MRPIPLGLTAPVWRTPVIFRVLSFCSLPQGKIQVCHFEGFVMGAVLGSHSPAGAAGLPSAPSVLTFCATSQSLVWPTETAVPRSLPFFTEAGCWVHSREGFGAALISRNVRRSRPPDHTNISSPHAVNLALFSAQESLGEILPVRTWACGKARETQRQELSQGARGGPRPGVSRPRRPCCLYCSARVRAICLENLDRFEDWRRRQTLLCVEALRPSVAVTTFIIIIGNFGLYVSFAVSGPLMNAALPLSEMGSLDSAAPSLGAVSPPEAGVYRDEGPGPGSSLVGLVAVQNPRLPSLKSRCSAVLLPEEDRQCRSLLFMGHSLSETWPAPCQHQIVRNDSRKAIQLL